MPVARWLPLALALVAVAGLHAHHGSADYHVDRDVTVTGTIKEWKFSNPHTWVYLTSLLVTRLSVRGDAEGRGGPRVCRVSEIKRRTEGSPSVTRKCAKTLGDQVAEVRNVA